MGRGPVIGVGLVSALVGIGVGLVVTWVLWPVEFKNADPADLRESLKDDYVRMVSAAYRLDGDLTAAKRRLVQLELDNSTRTFNDLLARERSSPGNGLTQDALIFLGQALGLEPSSVFRRPTPSPIVTPQTLIVVASPTEPVLVFGLVEQTQLGCAEEPDTAHFRFIVRDLKGRDLPGVAIDIRWENGDETVYTGLKPERGTGYADFEAAPGTYSVTIMNAQSATVPDLIIGEAPTDCRADRGTTPRGWKLVFQQQ